MSSIECEISNGVKPLNSIVCSGVLRQKQCRQDGVVHREIANRVKPLYSIVCSLHTMQAAG